MEAHVSRHEGLLGTVIELIVDADDPSDARAIEDVVIDRIDTLQQVFDVYRPESEISRWRRGEIVPGFDLAVVLSEALDWMSRSRGAFNPAVATLKQTWADAAVTGSAPANETLEQLAAAIAEPPYAVVDGAVVRRSDRADEVDLNAIAKGWIVDRAVEAGLGAGAVGITVNAGGDIVHRSHRSLLVGIEDPRRPYDNVAPMARIRLVDRAIATSGGARRFWRIAGRRYGQVLDPRTGRPAERVLSASVIADDAATADAAATTLTVMTPDEGVAWAEDLDLGALVLDVDGVTRTTPQWHAWGILPA